MNLELRSAVKALIPPDARILRDRGEGLYRVSAPLSSAYFCVEPLPDGWYRVWPNARLLLELERRLAPDAPIARAFLRFRGREAGAYAVRLFCEGIKLLETPQPGKVRRFSQSVRQWAARCLREDLSGGGLYALSILLSRLEGFL